MLDNPNLGRIKELVDAYKVVAAREKFEKDRKKYTSMKNRRFQITSSGTNLNAISGVSSSSSSISDKYGILTPIQKRQQQQQNPNQTQIDMLTPLDKQLQSLIKPAETVESFEPLSSDFYTQNININSSKAYFTLCWKL